MLDLSRPIYIVTADGNADLNSQSNLNLQHNNNMEFSFFIFELMGLLLAGVDQSQADQQNSQPG
eukprot:1142339-Pelagomonas_calceolata.AAC.2